MTTDNFARDTEIHDLRKKGLSPYKIAPRVGLSVSRVYHILKSPPKQSKSFQEWGKVGGTTRWTRVIP